jgi:hypothetical protein
MCVITAFNSEVQVENNDNDNIKGDCEKWRGRDRGAKYNFWNPLLHAVYNIIQLLVE